MKRVLVVIVAILVVALPLLAACGDEETTTEAGSSPVASSETVVGVIGAEGDLSTLSSAITAAGLEETLNGTGPFTVFAPENAAFDALPAGALDELLADPTGALTDVLTFHVVADEKLMEADLAAGVSVETVQGEKIFTITGKDGKLYVNAIEIVRTDLVGSNGVVHVIDGVLIPPED